MTKYRYAPYGLESSFYPMGGSMKQPGSNPTADAFLSHRQRHTDANLIVDLTARELEVLQLITKGLSNPAIAEKLIISVGTVKAHTASIYRKLGTKNRVQAFSRAQELHLL